MNQRELDLELLHDLVRHGHDVGVDGDSALANDEHDSFADILRRLERGQPVMTQRQRAWCVEAAERIGLGVRRDNSRVPAGKPVVLAIDSMPKPLSPPGRRSA